MFFLWAGSAMSPLRKPLVNGAIEPPQQQVVAFPRWNSTRSIPRKFQLEQQAQRCWRSRGIYPENFSPMSLSLASMRSGVSAGSYLSPNVRNFLAMTSVTYARSRSLSLELLKMFVRSSIESPQP